MPGTKNCTFHPPISVFEVSVNVHSTHLLTLPKPRVEQELFRLNRNKERRFAREKQKGIIRPDGGGEAESPAPAADGEAEGSTAGGAAAGSTTGAPTSSSSSKPAGTQRKCANCGQVGHIKTNKKCVGPLPLLTCVAEQEANLASQALSYVEWDHAA